MRHNGFTIQSLLAITAGICLLAFGAGCKSSNKKPPKADQIAGIMQEYKDRLAIPANARLPKVTSVTLKPGTGKNRDGWYIEDYGGVHGVNFSSCNAGKTQFILAVDPATMEPDQWTMRHEALHPVLNDVLCYPNGQHGFSFIQGNGNPGHPEFIVTPTGKRVKASTLIGGRWPARVWSGIKEAFVPGSPGDEFSDLVLPEINTNNNGE